MALTVTISLSNPGATIAGAATQAGCTIANTNATAVTLTALSVSESTESDAVISQPNFLTANAPPGTANPVIAAGGSLYVPFSLVFNSPYSPGVSPSNGPGNRGTEADASFILLATAQTSDGSVFASSFQIPVLSTIAPFPVALGGALQLNGPSNAVNFLAVMI